MPTFCDDWLAHSKRNEQVVCSSPIVAPGAGLKFVEAPQDVRTAVVIGAANGFPTQGTVLLKSEIPTGWHTASHIDGQEAMFVLEGSAFAVADGRHYDFKAGTMMHVACTSEQTLVNTRSRPASYPSARTPEVDLQVLPGRFEQRNEKGEGNDPLMVAHPTEETHSALWRPIALHTEGMADAAEEARLGGERQRPPRSRRARQAPPIGMHRHCASWVLIGGDERRTSSETNGFVSKAPAMTRISRRCRRNFVATSTPTPRPCCTCWRTLGTPRLTATATTGVAGDAVLVPP